MISKAALTGYLEKLESLGGIDIFFMGFGPEAEAASHLCYIKPGCGATFSDFAGIIPISRPFSSTISRSLRSAAA